MLVYLVAKFISFLTGRKIDTTSFGPKTMKHVLNDIKSIRVKADYSVFGELSEYMHQLWSDSFSNDKYVNGIISRYSGNLDTVFELGKVETLDREIHYQWLLSTATAEELMADWMECKIRASRYVFSTNLLKRLLISISDRTYADLHGACIERERSVKNYERLLKLREELNRKYAVWKAERGIIDVTSETVVTQVKTLENKKED